MTAPGGPVLVGVDGGPATADVLALGRWFAQALRAPLAVAAVHPAPSAIGSGRVDAEWVADRRRAAEQVLAAVRSKFGEAEGAEFHVLASSSAAHGLHDFAERAGAELIVLGAGSAAPAQRVFAGSTAERLLAGSVCPVAITPHPLSPPPGTVGRVGVAYIDTPDGRAALTAAARLGLPVRLTTVVAGGPAAKPFLIGADAERAFLDTARETYEEALRKAAESVPSTPTDWEIRSGDVVETLAELTDVDLLFCGSRGYGPGRRVLLGGVSARLARRSRRPLVVVPRAG